MFRSGLLGAACVALFMSSLAEAEPFDDFVAMCVATNAQQQLVATSAKNAGWVSVPAAEVFGEDAEFEDPQIFLAEDPASFGDKGLPEDVGLLFTGWGNGEEVFDFPGVRMDFCAVATQLGLRETLHARLQTLIGFDPIEMDGEQVWVFSRQGQSFRTERELMELDEAMLPEIARTRKLYFAGVTESDGALILIMAAIRPSR